MSRPVRRVDALVVGGGPAGLAAATALREGGAGSVVVVEREDHAGGVPRHCHHSGFGLRDQHRVLSGPAYAQRWADRAVASGATLWTQTMVTGWSAEGHADLTGRRGRERVEARAVVLATGARERPRAALLVPGSRPSGVFTTGQLQRWVHGEHLPLGHRAVIIGAEHVSYSAVLTLREAGVRPLALVTRLPRSQTFAAFDLLCRVGLRVPVWTETTVTGIHGRDRVDRVELRGPDDRRRHLAVDTVVFTGEWVTDHELARAAGLAMDPGTGGPACDAGGATSLPGYFAAGNLVHPVETADAVAVRAASVGAAAAAWLRRRDPGPVAPADARRVRVEAPLRWVAPNLVRTDHRSNQPVLLRSGEFLDRPRLQVEQGGRVLASYVLRRMVPNRSHHIPSDWCRAVDPGGDEVCISVSSTR